MSDEPKVIGYGVVYAGWMIQFKTEQEAQQFSREHGDHFGLHIKRMASAKDYAKWMIRTRGRS